MPALLAATVVIALWVVFWWPSVSGAAVLYFRDLMLFALPAKQHLLERLAGGELPHWTPLVSGGLPFAADPANQVFYPLNLLLLSSADTAVALTRFVLVHLLLGMLSMTALTRRLGCSWTSAVMAGAVYGFSGYAISITDNINYVSGVAWAPLALAAWLGSGRARSLALCALALAMMLLAGDVLSAAVCAVALLLLALIGGDDRRQGAGAGNRALALASLTGVVVLGVAVAAVQVLPALAMIEGSVREAGLTHAQQTEWSLPPVRTLELVQPFFFGSTVPVFDFLAPERYPVMGGPWAMSVYVGLLPVLLAGAAVFTRPRAMLPWLLLATGALLLAYGGNAPWHGWLSELLPLLGSQRYPEKLILWTTLALAVLSALGLDALRSAQGPFARLAAARAFDRVMLTIVVVAVQFFLLLDWPARLLVWAHAQRPSLYWSERLGMEATHLQGLLLHSLPLTLLMLLVLWLPARRYSVVGLLVASAVVADLAWVHRGHAPTTAAALLLPDDPVALRLLRDAGAEDARVYFDDEYPGNRVNYVAGRMSGLLAEALGGGLAGQMNGYLQVYAVRFRLERLNTQYGITHGLRYLNGRYSPLQPASHVGLENALADGDAARLLAASGTAHVITSLQPVNPAFRAEHFRQLARDEELNLRLLAVPGPQPFARIASAVHEVVAGDSYDTLVALHERSPRAALLQAETALVAELAGPTRGAVVQGWRRPAPERIEVRLDGVENPALLVLTESWAPGWQARVDGVAVMPLPADLRVLGVPLPAGAQQVVLAYRTPRLEAGALASAVALVVCLLLAMRRR